MMQQTSHFSFTVIAHIHGKSNHLDPLILQATLGTVTIQQLVSDALGDRICPCPHMRQVDDGHEVFGRQVEFVEPIDVYLDPPYDEHTL